MNRIDEIRKRVNSLKIITQALMQSPLQGDMRSSALGSGFLFDQTREYQIGDDVRYIDWNAYARTGSLSIKQYKEERKKTVYVLLDVSGSSAVDTAVRSKRELEMDLAALIMLATAYSNDAAGIVAYSDTVEYFAAPCKRVNAVSSIIESAMQITNSNRGTAIESAIEKILSTQKKNRAVIILISDFIDSTLSKHLKFLQNYYDVRAIRCLDPVEYTLQFFGFLRMSDIETGESFTTAMRSASFDVTLQNRLKEQKQFFMQHNVPLLDIVTNEDRIFERTIQFFLRHGERR